MSSGERIVHKCVIHHDELMNCKVQGKEKRKPSSMGVVKWEKLQERVIQVESWAWLGKSRVGTLKKLVMKIMLVLICREICHGCLGFLLSTLLCFLPQHRLTGSPLLPPSFITLPALLLHSPGVKYPKDPPATVLVLSSAFGATQTSALLIF